MSSQPPPMPRRADYTVLWIMLGVLLFGGVLAFAGVYIFARYIARQISMDIRSVAGGKAVNIETPVGSLEVSTGEISERQLDLPIYPGARRQKKQGATISLEVPSEKTVRVVAAEFETDDSLDDVATFYRKWLGDAAIERRRNGHLEFVMHVGGKQKLVLLRKTHGRTEIALASITEAGPL